VRIFEQEIVFMIDANNKIEEVKKSCKRFNCRWQGNNNAWRY